MYRPALYAPLCAERNAVTMDDAARLAVDTAREEPLLIALAKAVIAVRAITGILIMPVRMPVNTLLPIWIPDAFAREAPERNTLMIFVNACLVTETVLDRPELTPVCNEEPI